MGKVLIEITVPHITAYYMDLLMLILEISGTAKSSSRISYCSK